MQFNVHEAKTQFSKLLDRAVAGEDIIISRQGRPIVRLTPIRVRSGRVLGLGRGEFPLPATGWQGPLSDRDLDDLVNDL
jgi:prevent-host-death family protein